MTKMISDIAPALQAWALIAAAVVAFISYVSSVHSRLAQHLADRYSEIARLLIEKPEFFDPIRTRRYETQWNSTKREQYEAIARISWLHVREILQARFLVLFFRRRFIRRYSNAFELYRNAHLVWLRNNPTFLRRRHYRFVTKCRWREYLNPRTADRVRWDNAVFDYAEVVLDPLATNPALLHEHVQVVIAGQSALTHTVADLGCGPGKLVKHLLDSGFQRVFALDISERMLSETMSGLDKEQKRRVVRRQIDMRDLRAYRRRFNLLFSTNSILPREPADLRRILREVRLSLAPDGQFIAIVPAYDTIRELKKAEFDLFAERRLEEGGPLSSPGVRVIAAAFDRWRAYNVHKRMSGWFGNSLGRLRVVRFLARKLLARSIGPTQFADDGANVQRFLTIGSLRREFKRARLDIAKGPTPVYYSWSDALQCGYGNFADPQDTATLNRFPYDADRIYDWFLVAKARR